MPLHPLLLSRGNAVEYTAHKRGLEAGAKALASRYTGSPGTIVEKAGAAFGGASVGVAQAKAAVAQAPTRVARNAAVEAAPGTVVTSAAKGAGGMLMLSTIADVVDYGSSYVKAYKDTKAKIDARSTRREGGQVHSAY